MLQYAHVLETEIKELPTYMLQLTSIYASIFVNSVANTILFMWIITERWINHRASHAITKDSYFLKSIKILTIKVHRYTSNRGTRYISKLKTILPEYGTNMRKWRACGMLSIAFYRLPYTRCTFVKFCAK